MIFLNKRGDPVIKRNLWLDLFKIFLCFLVICIHNVRQAYTHFPVYRMAVPAFFIISGYFIYTKEESAKEGKAINFIRRSFIYMMIGILFYFIYDLMVCYRNGMPLDDFFKSQIYDKFFYQFFFMNYSLSKTANHLWFLIALFTVSIIHYFLVKFKLTKIYPFIMIFCLGIHFFFSGYFPGFEELDVSLFYLRNGLYFGLPLFALGYLMAHYNFHTKSWFKYLYLGLGIFFFFFQIIDARGLILEMYPSSVLASVFLIQFFLGLKPTKSNFYYKWFGKNMPFYIYILHTAVGRIIPGDSSLNGTYLKALVVLILSFVFYEGIYLLSKLLIFVKDKLTSKIKLLQI